MTHCELRTLRTQKKIHTAPVSLPMVPKKLTLPNCFKYMRYDHLARTCKSDHARLNNVESVLKETEAGSMNTTVN